MQFEYKTKGTCSGKILFEIENNKVKNVEFIGGCNGNLKGICSIVRGMKAEQVIERFEDVKCGFRSTSCPDQIAKNLKKALAEMN